MDEDYLRADSGHYSPRGCTREGIQEFVVIIVSTRNSLMLA